MRGTFSGPEFGKIQIKQPRNNLIMRAILMGRRCAHSLRCNWVKSVKLKIDQIVICPVSVDYNEAIYLFPLIDRNMDSPMIITNILIQFYAHNITLSMLTGLPTIDILVPRDIESLNIATNRIPKPDVQGFSLPQ
jgi:hypothetical protein